MAKVIVNTLTSEKRYVIEEDKKIKRLYIEQPVGQSLVGNIYLGIVTKVLPGMNAVFIDIGQDKQGFLHRDKLASFVREIKQNDQSSQKPISAFVHQGERILVQVEKDAAGTKGPRLTGNIEFQSDNLVYMPYGGFVATSQKMENSQLRSELKAFGEGLAEASEGIIFRTSSANTTFEELTRELLGLREEFKKLLKESAGSTGSMLLQSRDLFLVQLLDDLNSFPEAEIWVDDVKFKQKLQTKIQTKKVTLHYYQDKENIFSVMNVDQEVEKALKRHIWLDNGAFMVVDETEALTIFDVNTGKFVGKSNRQMTVYQVNHLAALEAARQIILRDLGGMILIDFIDMTSEKERQDIIKVLLAEFKTDPKKTRMIGFTELGILQLTRRKTKPTLSETMLVKCPTCDGSGKVFSPETVAFRLERELWEYRHSDILTVYITSSEDVYRLFHGENHVYLQKLEEQLGFNIQFHCEDSSKPFYHITKIDSL